MSRPAYSARTEQPVVEQIRYTVRESFQEQVLVAQDERRIDAFYRHTDGTWRMRYVVGLDRPIRLDSVAVDLPFAGVYAGVTFPPAGPDEGAASPTGSSRFAGRGYRRRERDAGVDPGERDIDG